MTYRTGMVEEVLVRVGVGRQSGGARKNPAVEIRDWDFNKVRQRPNSSGNGN